MSDAFDSAIGGYAYEHAYDSRDPGWADEPDDEHIPSLALSVEDWRDNETLEERNDRMRRRDAVTREVDRPGGDVDDPRLIERAPRPEVRERSLLASDAATARGFVRGREFTHGFGAGELTARPPRGRPDVDALRRRDALALIVLELREHGATIETIAAASSRTVSVVHDLLSRAAVIRKAEVEPSERPDTGARGHA